MGACTVQTLICLIVFAYFGMNDAISDSYPCEPLDLSILKENLENIILYNDTCGNSTISSYYYFIQQNIIMDRYSAAACKSQCDQNDVTCLKNCDDGKFSECAECKINDSMDCAVSPSKSLGADLTERSFCPSYGKWNIDIERYPMRLAESECICSECRGKADHVCEKLWTKIPVLRNTHEKDSEGKCIYSEECVDISVGCTCVSRAVHTSGAECNTNAVPPPP